MKKLLSAVTSVVMSLSLMTGAFASSVSAAGSLSASQPNVSMGEVLDVSANKTAANGTVEWLIPTVTAAPGQTVSLPVVVKGSKLAVAGAQFNIKAASPIAYSSATGGNAYGSEIVINDKTQKFAFGDEKGIERVAKDDSVVLTLNYTVPADCADGTYAVTWDGTFASDTDGGEITDGITFTPGAIVVNSKASAGQIEWVLDNVTAAPGETVTVNAKVNNSNNSALAVAGAQFLIKADSPVKYKTVKEGGAYASEIIANDNIQAFAFASKTGAGIVAADQATVVSVTYTVPSDCKEGKYAVKWSEGFVSDTDGKEITSNVKFTDGSITVKKDNSVSGKISWVLDNVKAEPGETVALNAVVEDSANVGVKVAGAQFLVKVDSPITYKSISEKSGYGPEIIANDNKQSFAFGHEKGTGVSAADGVKVFTLTYTVPADCPAGKYPVRWSNVFVSDTEGVDISENILVIDGSITVGNPDPVQGEAEWVIPEVEGKPGETVTLAVKVKGDSALPVAGAQFVIKNPNDVIYKSATGSPYGADLIDNGQKFAFAQESGAGKTAKDGSEIMVLTYQIPENCAEGVYAVEWANQFVSDTAGDDITAKVTFVNGSIKVGKVDPVNGEAKWVIPDVAGERGKTVTLTVKVEGDSALPVAGAQFEITNPDAVTYQSATGSPYGAELIDNGKKFAFAQDSGAGKTAKDGAEIITLTFMVPENCPDGIYPIEWSKQFVSDATGKDITDKVVFVNGSINVGNVTTTSTTITGTTTTTSGDGSTTTTTSGDGSTTTTTSGDGTTTTTSGDGSTTTTTSGDGTTTTTSGDGSTTTTTSGDGTTTTTSGDGSTTTTTSGDGTITTTSGDGSTTTTTSGDGSTTTTTSGNGETGTTTTVTAPAGAIIWQIDTVTVNPGDKVALKIYVNDARGSKLPVAGGQFNIINANGITFVDATSGDAYGDELIANNTVKKFAFADAKGEGTVAANGSVVAYLNFTIPEDCPAGVYPVEFIQEALMAFSTDGLDISDQIIGLDGAIIVRHVPGPFITTTTISGITTTTTSGDGSTTTTTSGDGTTTTTSGDGSTTTTTSGDGTTTTTSGDGSTTTTTSGDGTTTTTSGDGSTTTTTSGDGTTTTTSGDGSTTTTTSGDGTTTTTSGGGSTTTTTSGDGTTTTTSGDGSTTTTTSGDGTTTTTTNTGTTTTTEPNPYTTTTLVGYVKTYAEIQTQPGYYFSHDNGTREPGQKGGFEKNQIVSLRLFDVYEDGKVVERQDITMDPVNFKGETPESAYNSRTHVAENVTVADFKYDIPVYYGDLQLADKDGNPLTVPAYIGVKGDITLSNIVDAVDASTVLHYYALLSTDGTPDTVKCQDTGTGLQVASPTSELDQLAAFLGDVTENEWSADNWKKKKSDRVLDAVDASNILAFYARVSSEDYKGVSTHDIWDEVLGSKRYGK